MTTACTIIGEAIDADGLIEIYRRRKDQLGLTNDWFDQYSGLARGHIGKLFGDARVKNLGPSSIYTLNCNLAVKFLVVVDDAAEASMRPKWERRERPIQADASRKASLGKTTIRRVFPHIAREMQKRSLDVYMHKSTPEQRRRRARKAAKARWRKPKVVEIRRKAQPPRS